MSDRFQDIAARSMVVDREKLHDAMVDTFKDGLAEGHRCLARALLSTIDGMIVDGASEEDAMREAIKSMRKMLEPDA